MGISTKGIKSVAMISLSKTGLNYKPSAKSAQNNAATWLTIQSAITKKPLSIAALTEIVTTKHNHAPFIGYAIRRGWLQVS